MQRSETCGERRRTQSSCSRRPHARRRRESRHGRHSPTGTTTSRPVSGNPGSAPLSSRTTTPARGTSLRPLDRKTPQPLRTAPLQHAIHRPAPHDDGAHQPGPCPPDLHGGAEGGDVKSMTSRKSMHTSLQVTHKQIQTAPVRAGQQADQQGPCLAESCQSAGRRPTAPTPADDAVEGRVPVPAPPPSVPRVAELDPAEMHRFIARPSSAPLRGPSTAANASQNGAVQVEPLISLFRSSLESRYPGAASPRGASSG